MTSLRAVLSIPVAVLMATVGTVAPAGAVGAQPAASSTSALCDAPTGIQGRGGDLREPVLDDVH